MPPRFVLAVLFAVTIGDHARADMISSEGMAPWELCGLCHNLDGVSVMPKFPKLAGQRVAYIRKQFLDFHDLRRENDAGQMQAITTEVDLEQLDDIAAYFANLPAPPPIAEDVTDNTSSGALLFENGRADVPACAGCHRTGEVEGIETPAPWLEAQHRDYLIKQLTDFRSGARTNDPAGIMQSIASKLENLEIEALATYLASTQRPVKEH